MTFHSVLPAHSTGLAVKHLRSLRRRDFIAGAALIGGCWIAGEQRDVVVDPANWGKIADAAPAVPQIRIWQLQPPKNRLLQRENCCQQNGGGPMVLGDTDARPLGGACHPSDDRAGQACSLRRVTRSPTVLEFSSGSLQRGSAHTERQSQATSLGGGIYHWLANPMLFAGTARSGVPLCVHGAD